MNPVQGILVLCVRVYQRVVSPALTVVFGPLAGCRFEPTCSQYALEAVEQFKRLRPDVLVLDIRFGDRMTGNGPSVESRRLAQRSRRVFGSAREKNITHFPVVQSGRALGVVCTCDLADAKLSQDLSAVMHTPAATVQVDLQNRPAESNTLGGRATGGRTLVLFTSYDQLKRTSQAIAPSLIKEGVVVYEQGEGASPHSLLETFRNTERAVLLGTRSFWEGVDIPGDALSVLVIVKLPFDVPSDPLIAARSELYEDAFNEYYLPEAILKFRQGFGRLIRAASDRGVVAILDRRILTKQYGRAFLEAMPACPLEVV